MDVLYIHIWVIDGYSSLLNIVPTSHDPSFCGFARAGSIVRARLASSFVATARPPDPGSLDRLVSSERVVGERDGDGIDDGDGDGDERRRAGDRSWTKRRQSSSWERWRIRRARATRCGGTW